jgi:hypothetical protein
MLRFYAHVGLVENRRAMAATPCVIKGPGRRDERRSGGMLDALLEVVARLSRGSVVFASFYLATS